VKTGIPNNREIERKFLLKRLPEKLNRLRRYIIAQGYLATDPAGRQVRLRKKGKTASLTFKVGRGAHRALASDGWQKIEQVALRNSLERSADRD